MIIKGREKESISFIDKFNAVGNLAYSIFCYVKKSKVLRIPIIIIIVLMLIKLLG